MKKESPKFWEEYVETFRPNDKFEHESLALRVCQLAAIAASKNTYGVGALLANEQGEIIVEGHNESFVGGFRSDMHAEMVVMNRFEDETEGPLDLSGYTLVSSLEPCPMCMTRLIFAGVGTILHVCPDNIGGMVQRIASLPPIFRELTERKKQQWKLADCSEELREASYHIWDLSRGDFD